MRTPDETPAGDDPFEGDLDLNIEPGLPQVPEADPADIVADVDDQDVEKAGTTAADGGHVEKGEQA